MEAHARRLPPSLSPPPRPAPGLLDLPLELVREILSRTDQPGRVGCMLASKALLGAARHAPLYERLCVLDPDLHAARFAAFARPREIIVKARSPDDAALFLETFLDLGGGGRLQALTVEMGCVSRVPNALLTLATRFKELTELKITVERVQRGCDLVFPSGRRLPKLRTLWLVEYDDMPAMGRNVVVTFGGAQARMPALQHLVVAAQSSDVLSAGADAFPALRTVVYRSDDDTYGDLDLVDMELEHLELDVHSESHLDALFGQLAGMRRADTLSLVAWDDVLVDSPLPCRRLEVALMEREGCLQLDFVSLRDESPELRSLAVTAGDPEAPAHHPVMVRVVSVPGLEDFLDYSRRVHFDVATSARVHLEPL